jgi:hypothetical protein
MKHLGACISAMLLLLAISSGTEARAGQPVKFPIDGAFAQSAPAGTLCDFDYYEEVVVDGFVQLFVDDSGFIVESYLEHYTNLYVLHVNAETGSWFDEVDHYNVVGEQTEDDLSRRTVGLFWHGRNADGSVTVVRAGSIYMDFLTGEVTFTPNSGPDFAALVCPALGGAPA